MLPLVFIHTGTSFYLPTTLLQAAHASPRNERFFLGDWGSLALSGVAKRQPLRRDWRKAGELAKVFVNFSSNSAGFELVCLQRWLALAEWMQAHSIEECLYLDSDVMLHSDVELARRTVPAGAAMTISGISGHTNFISQRAVLDDFGDSILDHYTRPGGIEELRAKYQEWQTHMPHGGISDMTFFMEYRQAHPPLVADISQVVEGPLGPTTFDITMDNIRHYNADDKGLKAISLSADGHPMGVESSSGRAVRFHTLHFQGDVPKLNLARYATTPARARHVLERQNARYGLAYRAWKKLNKRG
jgi:hypothetical protein